jgi:hypothetical protein
MNKIKLNYLLLLTISFLALFISTSLMYYFALINGNNGISLNIFGGGDDGFFYWQQALNVARDEPWLKTSIYPLVIGYLLKITNIYDVYIIRIFNLIGFFILVYFSNKLTKLILKQNEVNNKKIIYQAFSMLLILLLFYSSLFIQITFSIYRDIWIYSLYVITIFYFIKFFLIKEKRFSNIFLFLVSLFLLFEFRDYTMLSFILSVFVYYFIKKFKLFDNKKVFFVTLFISICIYYFFIDMEILGYSLRRALEYRYLNLDLYYGGSQMWIKFPENNFVFFIINYLHSVLGNFIGPLPWHISSYVTLISFIIETIPMVIILLYLYKNKFVLSKIQSFILIHSMVWILFIAFTNDNIGASTRLRPISWILILIVFVSLNGKIKYNRKYMKKISMEGT